MSEREVERLLHEANHCLRIGQPQLAVERLKRLLALEPDDALGHGMLSLCLSSLKRPHAALHEAQLAATLEPDSALTHEALALALIGHRKLDQAEEHLRQALALEPEQYERHLALARLQRLRGRTAQQEASIARALELAPDHPQVLVASAELALERGDAKNALAIGEQALRLAPDALDAIVVVGQAHLRLGNLASAREHATWALAEDASDEGALRLLAALKARESFWLGLWWRYNAWLNERGTSGIVPILIGSFMAYRVACEVLIDFGHPQVADVVSYAWLALCAYTWVAPGLFARSLQKELGKVQLNESF